MRLYNIVASLLGDYLNSKLRPTDLFNRDLTSRTGQSDRKISDPAVSRSVDRYEPAAAQEPTSYSKPESRVPDERDIPDPAAESTGYHERAARLDYRLNLNFDLGALNRSLQQLADGDVQSVEQFATAGFGLSAGFDLTGTETIATNLEPTEGADVKGKQQQSSTLRQVGQFRVQSRDFALQSFYKEATDLRRTLDVETRDQHRQATNKIALRYRLDNQFSFSFARRFNIQAKQVADQAPDAFGSYLDTTGDVALAGSTDMMATFFDAVDSYLTQQEVGLSTKIEEFFTVAASDLGFSESTISAVADQLTSSIVAFFGRVESALAALEDRFVPDVALTAESPVNDAAQYSLPDSSAAATGQLTTA